MFDQIQALIDKYGRGNGYNKAAELVLIANSIINADGYPLHDVGVSAYTLRKFQIGSQAEIAIAAHIARARAKDNAFFEYVAKGPTVRFESMILKECPSKATDSQHPSFQWIWEREDVLESARKTMYWDCLFAAKLLSMKEFPSWTLTVPPSEMEQIADAIAKIRGLFN